MNRIKALLALAALTVAGAFAATTTPAPAFSNFVVWFKVSNNDASSSMIRQGSSLPSGVTGVADPASDILASASDPGSGHAVFSGPYPQIGHSAQTSFTYAKSDGSSACTYTITVTRNGSSSFALHFGTTNSTRCSVPSDANDTDGQFNTTTYVLNWQT